MGTTSTLTVLCSTFHGKLCHVFGADGMKKKKFYILRTPVQRPVCEYALHAVTFIDFVTQRRQNLHTEDINDQLFKLFPADRQDAFGVKYVEDNLEETSHRFTFRIPHGN